SLKEGSCVCVCVCVHGVCVCVCECLCVCVSVCVHGVQQKLGIMNRGVVYGLWDYEVEAEDELSFREGDCMTILRCEDKEGYIPRNLLGVSLSVSVCVCVCLSLCLCGCVC